MASTKSILIVRVVTGSSHGNCWIVAEPSGDAFVVDPGEDALAIAAVVERASLLPVALVATHAHGDHVGAAAELGRLWSIPLVLHRADESTLRRANLLRLAFRESPVEVPRVDRWLVGDEETLTFGAMSARAVATPGHTPGGIILEVTSSGGQLHLFTGDTLLRGTVGRTDLPGGSALELARSLGMVARYPRGARIHPGHGEESDLGTELDTNAKLRELIG